MNLPNLKEWSVEEVIALVLHEEHLYGEADRVAEAIVRRLVLALSLASSKTRQAVIRSRGGQLDWALTDALDPVAVTTEEPEPAAAGGGA